ncbi:MAG: hypothetical protein LH479_05240 [Polaromonas sp.]|nr:hypothetical protein [Polaromonas sp.]
MNKPSPAIVAQSAVRRLPRLALWLFCIAYVLPGFIGRSPWKNEDITAFGIMQELTLPGSSWLQPQMLGVLNSFDALAPYWLGAVAISAMPFLDPALAVRLPFVVLLAITLMTTWYGTYYLARSPQAQPVAFAFGGEAEPVDYARAIADASLLALIACLGLAQLSHETTPALAQLGFASLCFYALAAITSREGLALAGPALALSLGLTGLALSGAPTLALLLGAGGLLVELGHRRWGRSDSSEGHAEGNGSAWNQALLVAGVTVVVCLMSSALNLWRWRFSLAASGDGPAASELARLARLLVWFTWPAWPLALWTLLRWRRQLASRHVALPLWFSIVAITSAITAPSASDRSLLLALPPLAALAAFALPTLRRSVASLIDWFTLLFFTGSALVIWVIWIAMQTGFPRQPAANVARLAPGFEASFSWLAFVTALGATLAWAWLVKWRAGAQRAAIWKSLVLPAGGATLSWMLLMTLWLPLLDYARSYGPTSRQVARLVDRTRCVEIYGIGSAQAAGLRYHGRLALKQAGERASCPFLVVDSEAQGTLSRQVNLPDWALQATVTRPTDKNENVLVYRRVTVDASAPRAKKDSAPAPLRAP